MKNLVDILDQQIQQPKINLGGWAEQQKGGDRGKNQCPKHRTTDIP